MFAGSIPSHTELVVQRNRPVYAAAALAVILLGLSSRWLAASLPAFVGAYVGDVLWSVVAFLGIGLIYTAWPPLRVGAVALLFAFTVELTQLYSAPWINALRHTRVGGLLLGFGFLWSDLACYTAGIALALAIEHTLLTRRGDDSDLGHS